MVGNYCAFHGEGAQGSFYDRCRVYFVGRMCVIVVRSNRLVIFRRGSNVGGSASERKRIYQLAVE